MQTPGHVYEGANLDKLKDRARVAKILTQTKEDIRFQKLKKVDGPDPGSYNTLDSFVKTKASPTMSAFKGKGKGFIEQQIQSKKNVPSPG